MGNADRPFSVSDLAREKEWQRNWRSYWKHLDKIAERLGPRAYNFFRSCTNEAGLHDGFLLSLNFGDSIALSEASYSRLKFGRGPSAVAMTILDYAKTRLHQFTFKGPRKVVIDIPSDDPLFYEQGKTLGQIYHYEISSLTPKVLSIEWLLDSGGTIQIEFEKLLYRSKRVRLPLSGSSGRKSARTSPRKS